MNSDLKITLSRVLEKPLQINGTDTETHYINELFKRLVFHELLNKLNLKDLYYYRDNVKYCLGKVELNFSLNKQELDSLINQITSMDNVQIDLFPFQGYSTTYQELEYNYNYHIRYRTQRLKIQNQIEQESQQLIKNLILSNQINQITPTQIKIQF